MAEKVKMLIPEEEVNARIEELGKKISEEYAGKQVHLICVLKGGVFFMCELAKRITVPVTMDFMSVSSYGDGTQSSGIVKIAKDLDESLEGKDVIVVEDIVDSGRTLYYLLDILRKRGPKSMKLCTLLDKPDRRGRKSHTNTVDCGCCNRQCRTHTKHHNKGRVFFYKTVIKSFCTFIHFHYLLTLSGNIQVLC